MSRFNLAAAPSQHPHQSGFRSSIRAWAALCALLMATGCTTVAPDSDSSSPRDSDSAPQKFVWAEGKNWQTYRLPGKQPTVFTPIRMDGRNAMLAVANASASMLRQNLRIPASELQQVRFSWKVPQLIEEADLSTRERDDAPVRIVLAFEGDRSLFSAKNAMLSELSRVITGEELPYATLMYVWSKKQAPGSVVNNARTDRIRKIVIESGTQNLNQWLDYERDIKADFERAFGEAPGALVGIALMTDTDNTRSQTKAYYGPVTLAAK
jgi:hypothetical protein